MEEKIQNTYSSSTKRIAKNTLMLYFRQILIMLVSLYTVRVVLATLGAQDYGIYNVVAGVVTMFSFLSGSMATASQRYFSFALGQNDEVQLKRYFSMSFTIYCLIALVVVVVAETFGLWFVENKLVVPAERQQAAFWIYQASVFSTVCTILTAPFMASIITHEDMNIYAYVSVVEVVLKLGIVFLLSLFPADKLIIYSLLMAAVVFVNTAIYRTICIKKYSECKFSFFWEKDLFKELISYTGWNMFGAAVGVFKFQVVNIILNQFFNPIVNTARGIAQQVNSAVNSFAQNFSTAVRPQIIKTYATGEKERMLQLMFRSCKATFLLMYVFALPLILEMPYVLKIWLKNVPEYAIVFTSLALIDALIDTISYPIMAAAQATGKIKLYQFVVGGVLLLNAPITFVVLKFGANPYSVFIVSIVITFVAFIVRLCILKRLIDFSFWKYIFKVFLPVVCCSGIAFVIPYFVKGLMQDNFLRLCIIVIVSVICVGLSGYFVAFSSEERKIFINILKDKGR
ncbi:MAG: hypothetical protein J6R67_08575 [Treponema sp.]|nr:hypothetical protein [Treponema sp.]